MTPNALSVLFSSLVECGLVISTQAIKSQSVGNGRTLVEVGDTGPTSNFHVSHENSYEHYVRTFNEGRYSLLLFDGSMICLKYETEGDQIAWHRYLYFPSIVDLDVAEGEGVDFLPNAQQYFLTPRKTLLRFEYDPDSQAPRHPYSHLHVNSADCRIPVSGALTVKNFLYAVVDAFYPNYLEYLGALLRPAQPSITHLDGFDGVRMYVRLPL